MSLWSWLFGYSSPNANEITPVGASSSGRFGQHRHAPDGDWVQTTTVVKVAGIQHRRSDVSAFMAAVSAAETGGLVYGARLVPEPNNSYDANAMAVIGFAGKREWQIGYLDRGLAEELNRDLIDKGLPVAAELYAIWAGDNGFLDISIIVLAPPGNGMKARLRRRPT